MIKLFVTDIDGCLSLAYTPIRLAHFTELAECAVQALESGRYPHLSICSGRAYAYVEALTQALHIRMPVVFESGGGMFDPVAARITWNPLFTEDIDRQMDEVRRWMIREVVPGSSLTFDFGKRTQAGVIGPDFAEVARKVVMVEAYMERHYPQLHVFHTEVSIDVCAPGITKREGMHWLASQTGFALDAMAYIGDTNGDVGALEEVGFSFAPANGTPEVRDAARIVTQGAVSDGVIEAYRWCVSYNETRA